MSDADSDSAAQAIDLAVRELGRQNLDKFEVYYQRRDALKIDARDQKVDTLSRAQDAGIAIRALKRKRLGFSYTTAMHPQAITRAVESATHSLRVMPEDPHADLPSFAAHVYPQVLNFDAKGVASAIDNKIALALALERECRAQDTRITGVRSASFGQTDIEVQIVDSSGDRLAHRSSHFTLSILCKAESAGQAQMGHDFGFSHELDRLDPIAVARESARTALELLGAGSAPTMSCPAVFRNSVVAELIDFLSASFSAEEIDKGRSLLKGRFGERVFSPEITLIDDGLYPEGLATQPFDGEGVPSQRKVLIEGGFAHAPLYDTYYARKHGTRATGSVSRGIKSPPSIGTTNLYLAPGKQAPEQLIAGIERGVLITDLMGVHTANPVTGDFSLGASGLLIENGRLTRPMQGFAVAGNVLELLRRVTEVGSDLRFFGSTGAPSFRVSQLSVGGGG